MTVSWMSGHYADAIKAAQAGAAKGDANAEALLGRAYYEGLGVPQNRTEAKKWLTLAVNQNQPDAMFFLGLMEEYGRGVPQNVPGALALFDRAAALGQHYADMEAAGMRMQGEAAAQAARARGGAEGVACATRVECRWVAANACAAGRISIPLMPPKTKRIRICPSLPCPAWSCCNTALRAHRKLRPRHLRFPGDARHAGPVWQTAAR